MVSTSVREITLTNESFYNEENQTGTFFASYAIQILFLNQSLNRELPMPLFLKHYKNDILNISKRLFIKNIIENPNYKHLRSYISSIIYDNMDNPKEKPSEVFLKNIPKSFLIRQIFNKTEHTLAKYLFLESFINTPIQSFNFNEFYSNLKNLNIEEQTLCLIRIFSNFHDTINKDKKLMQSFYQHAIEIRYNKSKYPQYSGSLCEANLENYLLVCE